MKAAVVKVEAAGRVTAVAAAERAAAGWAETEAAASAPRI